MVALQGGECKKVLPVIIECEVGSVVGVSSMETCAAICCIDFLEEI